MAKAIFIREFHWSRIKGGIGFAAYPGPQVQRFPRDFVAAAVAAGAATLVPPYRAPRPAAGAEDGPVRP